MIIASFLAASAMLAAPFPGSARPSAGEAQVTYGCNDLVVVGRLANNGDYRPTDFDLLGHGWMTAEVRVRRILFGRVRARILPLRYWGHGHLQENLDFLLVLQPTPAGPYVLRTARVRRAGARDALSPTCGIPVPNDSGTGDGGAAR